MFHAIIAPMNDSPIFERTSETLAVVRGIQITELPKDLYIPPDALEVFLEAFEGPLDLLLYLIKKQNLDILDIPIAKVTAQYMQYVELMKEINLELAAEYLVMAVMLAEIKSRLLLPEPANDEADEDDPRAELIRRLREYERFKKAAEDLDSVPRINRDIYTASATSLAIEKPRELPKIELQELWFAFQEVLSRAKMFESHQVQREMLSTRERMVQILDKLQANNFIGFADLFTIKEGRQGIIVTFSALLELLKQAMIEIVQTEAYGKIHIKKVE